MRNDRFPERVERAHLVAVRCLVILFRVVVLALFAPIAWRYLVTGEYLVAVAVILVAFTLGAFLAPMD